MIEIHHTPATRALVDTPAPAQALVDVNVVDVDVPAESAAPQITEIEAATEPLETVTPVEEAAPLETAAQPAPKPRLTQVERLAKQLAEAEEKAREKARIKLAKTLDELTKAHADVARASARLSKAATDARALQDFVGGVEAGDLILTPEEIESHNTEVRMEAAANDVEYPEDYLTLGYSHASHRQMIATARTPLEIAPVEIALGETTLVVAPTAAEIEAATEPEPEITPIEESVADSTD